MWLLWYCALLLQSFWWRVINWLLRGKKPNVILSPIGINLWYIGSFLPWVPCAGIFSRLKSSLSFFHLECKSINQSPVSLQIALIELKWLFWLSLVQEWEQTPPKNNTKPILKYAVLAAVWRCFFLLAKARTFMTWILSKGDKSHFKWLETYNLENDSVSKWLWICSRWVSPWKMVVQKSELEQLMNLKCFIGAFPPRYQMLKIALLLLWWQPPITSEVSPQPELNNTKYSSSVKAFGAWSPFLIVAFLFISCPVPSGLIGERLPIRYYLTGGMLASGLFTAMFGLGYFYNVHNLWFYIMAQVGTVLI